MKGGSTRNQRQYVEDLKGRIRKREGAEISLDMVWIPGHNWDCSLMCVPCPPYDVRLYDLILLRLNVMGGAEGVPSHDGVNEEVVFKRSRSLFAPRAMPRCCFRVPVSGRRFGVYPASALKRGKKASATPTCLDISDIAWQNVTQQPPFIGEALERA